MEDGFLGIDPGKNGGLAAIDGDGLLVDTMVMPVFKAKRAMDRAVDMKTMRNFVLLHPYQVITEWFRPPGFNGKKTWYSLGMSLGEIHGLLMGLGRPFTRVAPKEWQKVMLSEYEYKGNAEIKACSVDMANSIWTGIGDHDGVCEAALIAEYGRRSAR